MLLASRRLATPELGSSLLKMRFDRIPDSMVDAFLNASIQNLLSSLRVHIAAGEILRK